MTQESGESRCIEGDLISLRPATHQDKPSIYRWMAQSDLTYKMMGLPDYPDCPIPSWEQFDADYESYYFEDADPWLGRFYVIKRKGQEIGQISYNRIDRHKHCVELDIWLSNSKHSGKGYGTDAVLTLCQYLHRGFDCSNFIMAPSARNINAIKSYRKAGFEITNDIPTDFVPDYSDTLVMVKKISS